MSDALARLCEAAARGDLAGVRAALAAGADPDAPCPDLDGETALHLAAAARGERAAEVVAQLLRAGADPLRRARAGTPVDTAAEVGHTAALERLLRAAGGDPDLGRTRGLTPLHRAAGRGHIGAVRLLLDAGADPNLPGPGGETPLHAAAGAGHAEVVHLLLARGADPSLQDREGRRWPEALAYARLVGAGRPFFGLVRGRAMMRVLDRTAWRWRLLVWDAERRAFVEDPAGWRAWADVREEDLRRFPGEAALRRAVGAAGPGSR